LRSVPALACAALLLAAPARAAEDKSEAARQMSFGVKMALAGSWNEAAFRFGKAVQADPGNAFAQNDLGVALESVGEYEKALASYTKAQELEPRNEKIRENRDRLQAYLATRNTPRPREKPGPSPRDPNGATDPGAPHSPPPGSGGGGG